MTGDEASSIKYALGRIEGAQETHQKETANRLDRLENLIAGGNNAAETSRRRLHETIEDSKSETVSELHKLDKRMTVVELQQQDLNNQMMVMAPMSALNEINSANTRLDATVTQMNSSVTALKDAKTHVEGAVATATMFTKIFWALALALGGAVGSWAFNAVHLAFGSLPPPPK